MADIGKMLNIGADNRSTPSSWWGLLLFTEVLEEALVGSDPEGPLCELLFFFLSAIFQALAEEQEEVAKDQVAEADTKG